MYITRRLFCVALTAVITSVKSVALPAIVEDGFYAPGVGHRTLIIKSYPAIENFQSDLYEVYMEPYAYDLRTTSAIALVQGDAESSVKGEVTFLQKNPPGGPVVIQGNFSGLPTGKHGVHIQQSGDLRQGCEKLGGHFNPYLMQHGGPADPFRHAGDLGNVEAGEDEEAQLRLVDPVISLAGPRSVVGRALIITEEPDDLGRGGTADSITTGSSGKPLACGVIAYVR